MEVSHELDEYYDMYQNELQQLEDGPLTQRQLLPTIRVGYHPPPNLLTMISRSQMQCSIISPFFRDLT